MRLFYIALECITLLHVTACHKPSAALPAPNDTSHHDTTNIDTPTISNSAYDSSMMYFYKEMNIYKDISATDSIVRYIEWGAYVNHFNDTFSSLVIRVNDIKLDFSYDILWWLKHIDSISTPGYPTYDSARIQFTAPNGFKDLDYRMPYIPFYAEPIPYLLSRNGFSIPLVANKLAGADSVHISMSGVYFDTTLKITDCSILIDSAWIHQMCSSFPADVLINVHPFKWFNVSSHGKKYSFLNASTASYHVLVQ